MRNMNHKEQIIKLALAALILLCAIVVCWYCDRWAMRYADGQRDTLDVRVDSIRDTLVVEYHDTVPKEVAKTVLCYVNVPVPVPAPSDSAKGDSTTITMPVVQKTYTDDSTYTAYVSGVDYQQWPRLDSIITRQRQITNTINNTITVQKKPSRLSVGLQAGYGYGFQYKGFEPYVGIGVNYALFPP